MSKLSQSLDAAQVIQSVHDEVLDRLRVDIGPSSLVISATTDSIRIGDGTDLTTTTTIGGNVGLDVNIIGGVSLQTGLKTSTMVITDVPSQVPASALVGRNSLTLRIWGDKKVFFGGPSVTVADGYPKFQYEEISLDIKDTVAVDVWAVCATGETSEIRIMELA